MNDFAIEGAKMASFPNLAEGADQIRQLHVREMQTALAQTMHAVIVLERNRQLNAKSDDNAPPSADLSTK